ncbi:hypothetical protein JQM68_13555 [Oscillibacter valericigenes]|uniref:hypothetical protein n=1 Tax=Oscillibacter valericigenes TaxID=351091 RepID=UPI001F30A3B1|nr:hypothetical protein [Oscillibacter valericigenes]MCF2618200.1 hypothetical protein [Oscillibacter valericigenes]
MAPSFPTKNGPLFPTKYGWELPTPTAYSKAGIVTVDEIIEFLEQHRGKEFWASGNIPCFCANDKVVLCDSGDYVLNEIENDDFLEPLEQFFYHV